MHIFILFTTKIVLPLQITEILKLSVYVHVCTTYMYFSKTLITNLGMSRLDRYSLRCPPDLVPLFGASYHGSQSYHPQSINDIIPEKKINMNFSCVGS